MTQTSDILRESALPNLPQLFADIGEPYAAGLFECTDKGAFFMFSRALRRFYEQRPVNEYTGGRLYPSGLDRRGAATVQPDCAKTFNPATGGKGTLLGFYEPLSKKSAEAADIMLEFRQEHNFTVDPSDESITISGYTHSMPHYERVLAEGLDSYAERIDRISDVGMRDGLHEVLHGLRNYHGRCLDHLRSNGADPRLIAALEKVPFKPADSIYEAIVGWTILYLDNTDNVGWIGEGLSPYFHGENVVPELRELFQNVADNDGWSATIGPRYTELTKQCLEACKGLFRPMLELRVRKDMPEDIWDLAIETLYSGGGQPSFYNEEMVQKMLAENFPEFPESDRMRFAGAGCTEPTLAGMSNTGGIDANLNLALIFEKYLYESLSASESFEQFYEGYRDTVADKVDAMLSDVYRNHESRAKNLPNPLRSLLIDDCIDRGLDYNNRGARYNAALTAESGMINVIDSLAAVRELVFEQHAYSPADFMRLLRSEDEHLYRALRKCPHYGLDDEVTNGLAAEFSDWFYSLFENRTPYRGGLYTPSSHQFNRYGKEGKRVGPTPDGRKSGEPLCDSVAPIGGKAIKGPTAALLSASHLSQEKILGIPVYNLSVQKRYPKPILKGLIEGYFGAGGVQVQVTMSSKDEILDAIKHPERHEDLVVRVGGYSEYFNRLTPELKQAFYERTIYAEV